MAINPNTDFSSGAVLTAAQQNRFPRGVMANVYYTGANTTATVTPTVTDITGLTATFTAVANRTYKVSWLVTGQKSTTQGWTGVFLTNAANTIFASVYSTAPINGYWNCSGVSYFSSLAAGSQTLKLRLSTENSGSSSFGTGANPAVMIVEDCGPS